MILGRILDVFLIELVLIFKHLFDAFSMGLGHYIIRKTVEKARFVKASVASEASGGNSKISELLKIHGNHTNVELKFD